MSIEEAIQNVLVVALYEKIQIKELTIDKESFDKFEEELYDKISYTETIFIPGKDILYAGPSCYTTIKRGNK